MQHASQPILVDLALGEAGQAVLTALAQETPLLFRHQLTVCIAAYDLVIPPLVAQLDLAILLKAFDRADLEELIMNFESQ